MLEGPFTKILPLLIFGVTSMVAGLSALILPETGNLKLPDTLQDIRGYSRFGNNVIFSNNEHHIKLLEEKFDKGLHLCS